LKVLDNLSLEIEENVITAVVGPNGSGKTTLLNTLCGIVRPNMGKIFFKSMEITRHPSYMISKLGIGRTFQNIRIFPQLTVLENVLLGLNYNIGRQLFSVLMKPHMIKKEEKTKKEKAIKYLKVVGLEEKRDELAKNLSYGQRRLLEFIRAFATDAELILFDEPTAGVFPEIRERIIRLFKDWKKIGKTIIFVEHDMETVREAADRVIVLDKGKIIADGEPEFVLEEKVVIDAYFGGAGD